MPRLARNCRCPQGSHEIYCCGSKVKISEKGIYVLTPPLVTYCPLHESLYGTKQVNAETVRKSVQKKISEHGFCCPNRKFNTEPIVAYGASEMMSVWLEKGLIDCAVVVCEGAGTVITDNSRLVQAIGARLTGIIKTTPIPRIIKRIEAESGIILDKRTAKIDQLEGVKTACEKGFKKIAVSVAGFQANAISRIRQHEKATNGDLLIFSVCNTCIRDKDVKHIAKADVACASASKLLRAKIGSRALLQLGTTIPVYALTRKGKRLVLAYLEEFSGKLVVFRTRKLPYYVEGKGPRLA